MKLINKLFLLYKNISQPIKASLWITFCNFLQRGISMITTPIFTRVLSTEEYGVASTYFAWNSLVYMVTSLCLYKALMNLYIKYSDKERVLSYLLSLEFTITSIWAIVICAFSRQFSVIMGLPSEMIVALGVSSVSQGIIDCWIIYKRYIYDYKKVVFVTLIQSIVSSFVSAFLVFYVIPNALFRVMPQVCISSVIAFVIFMVYTKKYKCFFDAGVWRYAICFCGVLMPHYLYEYVLNSSDKLMINAMCTKTDVAIYSIAYSVGSLIVLVTSAINASFAPFRYQKIKEKDYEELSSVTTKVLALVGMFLVLIMVFGSEIVLVFGGYKYLEATTLIVPICLGVYFNYMFQIFASVQEYYEKKKNIVIASVMCALSNITLNYIFIRMFGYKAAAYTTFVCYLLFCYIHYLFYKKLCREELDNNEIYDIKQLTILSVLMIVAGVIAYFVSKNIFIKYCVLVSMLAVCFIFRKKIYKSIVNMAKA